MYGFVACYGLNFPKISLPIIQDNCTQFSLFSDNFQVCFNTRDKFLDDKLFVDTDEYFVLFDGVLFNKAELIEEYDKAEYSKLLYIMYRAEGASFVNKLRGTFAGMLYDKKHARILVFNDHIGSKPLYVSKRNSSFWVSSNLFLMNKSLIQAGISTSIDELTLSAFLSYGYSPTENSWLKDVQRVRAGFAYSFGATKKQLKSVRYHQFENNPTVFDSDLLLDLLDEKFQQAVSRILNKNRQYGYDNLSTISAGLDSRMVVWVAQLLGAKQKLFSFSQSGYYDDLVSKDIAKELNAPISFKPLDGGDYLVNLDEVVRLTQGLVNYSGAAQMWDSLRDVYTDKTGIILTGMVGEIVLGTAFTKKNPIQSYEFGLGALSKRMLPLLNPYLNNSYFTELYSNRELLYLYLRAFAGANFGGPLVMQNVGETFSPFLDVDFLEFMYSVSIDTRWSYNLYDRWILDKYPDAAKWKHNGDRTIGKKAIQVTLGGRLMPLKDVPLRMIKYALKKLHIVNFEKQGKTDSMNPLDYWMESNPHLSEFYESYFNENIHLLDGMPIQRQAAEELFKTGVVMEKAQVLTILSMVKQLLNN